MLRNDEEKEAEGSWRVSKVDMVSMNMRWWGVLDRLMRGVVCGATKVGV